MEETRLTKISRFVKTEKYLIILALTALLLLLYKISPSINQPTQPQSAGYKNSVFPGVTSQDQVKKNLGEPERTETKDGSIAYLYPTDNQFRKNSIEFSNDKVAIVKEQVTSTKPGGLSVYQQQYGKEEAILYGHHSTFAPGFFWGRKGILVFANQHDGTVFEIWYFQSISQEEFLIQNPDLSTEHSYTESH